MCPKSITLALVLTALVVACSPTPSHAATLADQLLALREAPYTEADTAPAVQVKEHWRPSLQTATHIMTLLDVASSCYLLNNYEGHEANPVYGKGATCEEIAVANAVLVGVTALLRRHSKKRARNSAFHLLPLALRTYIVVHNVEEIQNAKAEQTSQLPQS